MLALLMRIVMFMGAMVLTADVFMRPHTEVERIAQHVVVSHWRRADDHDLRFAGGKVGSCDVGYPAFGRLRDGDELTLTSSAIFNRCTGIARGEEVVTAPGVVDKLVPMVFVAIMLLIAFGWITPRRGDDDDRRDDSPWWWFSW